MSGNLTNCKNCGAPLPGHPCKCEYCGTVYGKIDEWNEIRLFADVEGFVKATSAGLVTPNEARRMIGLERRLESINEVLSESQVNVKKVLSKY